MGEHEGAKKMGTNSSHRIFIDLLPGKKILLLVSIERVEVLLQDLLVSHLVLVVLLVAVLSSFLIHCLISCFLVIPFLSCPCQQCFLLWSRKPPDFFCFGDFFAILYLKHVWPQMYL